MRVLFFYCKTCFQKGNLTQILAEVRRIWFCLAALVTENRMTLSQSVSAKPYGYVLVGNQPMTTTDKQVVADVFGHCQSYPYITKSTHPAPEVTQGTPETESCRIEPSEVKQKGPNQCAKKSKVSGKRKVELEKPPAKRKRTETKQTKRRQSKPSKQRVKAKPKTQKKKQPQGTKPAIYKAKFIVTPPRESSEEEQFNSEENESLNPTTSFQDESNSFARQQQRFGPKMVYEKLKIHCNKFVNKPCLNPYARCL